MSKFRFETPSHWARVACLYSFLAFGHFSFAQVPVVTGNTLSPVWESLYGAQGVDPDADPDGDGLSNRQEAIAGTDPFNAASAPRMSMFVITNKSAQVRIMGALGKLYELQGSEIVCGLSSSNTWITEASLVARTNPMVTLSAPALLPMKFFRVRISDVDTDGDGLTDWEEYQLGLDPFKPFSNGEKDANGKPLTDSAYAMRRLNFQPRTYGIGDAPAKADLFLYAKDFSDGTGLTGEYYTNSSRIYTNIANFNPANLFLVTNDAAIDFRWGPATTPNLSNQFCTVRWTGQVKPQFTEAYVFETRTDDGVKLWVNDQLLIDSWQYQGTTTWTNTINLTADVRYNIRMEYYNYGFSARAQLFWHSDSQPRQIIPAARLYPSANGYAPSAVTTPLNAIAFLGQPFSYAIQAANTPLSYEVTNLPAGLTFDSTDNLIAGIPNVAGTFVIGINVSNIVGIGASQLNLRVIDTGSSISREVWTGVSGTSVTNIPVNLPPSSSNVLGSLEGITSFGDNYGERIRGFLTAPVTGNYYFWISANNSAELWISNDSEPVNKVRRAYITKGTTTPHVWNLQASQRSPWLALKAGQVYYIEILHKAGIGTGDHWSVGWEQDPSGTNTVPAGIVPGYVLTPYSEPSGSAVPGTLYSANMLAQPGVSSSGIGSSTLRLSPDETQAILKFAYSGLTGPATAKHIHADTYKAINPQGQIIFDIDAATPEPDGSYIWQIAPSGTLTVADLVEIIKEGKSYLNIHTANYPGGEISGHFTLANGSSTFTPPPAPPAWTDDHANSNSVARFLQQATFGSSPADIKAVKTSGYSGWITKQYSLPVTGHLPVVLASLKANPTKSPSGILTFNTWWKQSVTAPDQLRQRVAFSLSEIMVVSEAGTLAGNPLALSSYYDTLLKDAFGNFRTLLKDVTIHPAMGLYLDMRRNDKANSILGTRPNENYAREIMQLFSIGLNRMWPDGTLVLNSQGEIVPTYDQHVIEGYARVFTGWNYCQTNQVKGRLPTNWNPPPNYTNVMVLVSQHHELGTKALLDNIVLPPANGPQTDLNTTNFDAYCSQDLDKALDSLFYNENVGPFICRELIQRLVTSHPSRDYVYRVVQAFDNNEAGVRGDMKAVIKAILLDYEARSPALLDEPTFGKQREPLLRATAVARAFPSPVVLSGSYSQKGTPSATITTSKPHRLGPGDDVFLSFSGTKAPASHIYYNVAITGPNTFTVTPDGYSLGTYGQSANVITVTNSNHGLAVGYQIYLTTTSGGAQSGIYIVQSVPSSSIFTLTASDSATRSGTCLFPSWDGSTLDQSQTNITVTTSAPHCLAAGNIVYVVFPVGSPQTNGVFKVASVSGPFQFKIRTPLANDSLDYDAQILPLVPAPLTRSGNVSVGYSTWDMEYTDTGWSSSLSQTPLHSPTVFNFFFPDYKFPGVLASSGLTTPEFQLTSDSSVIMQMNFFSTSMLNNGSNTNGLSSFVSGNGSIALDLSPWMTPAYTADSGIPGLVDALSSLLCAGQVSDGTKQIIVSYVANPRFPYTTPTATQMRDRVRAVAHLIATSSEFAIQR
jgi:Protein of unknown function (DUF1800)/PA14 domain/CHRD domain/Bacterial TSP3 repeat/Putative Ig domain